MPPTSPYPISGKILDVDGSTAVADASITAFIKRTGAQVPVETSNASGNYIIDLANVPSNNLINGDIATVEVTSGNKRAQYNTTVNTSKGFEEVDITLKYLDVLGMIIDYLSDGWDKSRTDGIKPTFVRIVEKKEIDLYNGDYVLVYELTDPNEPFSMGGQEFLEQPVVSIDMQTTFKNESNSFSSVRQHTIRMKDEIYRIIKSNINPNGGFFYLAIQRRRDLSDKTRGNGRMVIDVITKKID